MGSSPPSGERMILKARLLGPVANSEDLELLESLFVGLYTLAVTGVLLEVHRRRDRYVLLETAPATGNRLFRFSSRDK
jgi:hypothetical protein